jgi:hypothetical protein
MRDDYERQPRRAPFVHRHPHRDPAPGGGLPSTTTAHVTTMHFGVPVQEHGLQASILQ